MGGKLFKWATAAALLGAGAWATDFGFYNFVHPNLPAALQVKAEWTPTRKAAYHYFVIGLGTILVVPFAARLVGMSDKSPVKTEVSPLKS